MPTYYSAYVVTTAAVMLQLTRCSGQSVVRTKKKKWSYVEKGDKRRFVGQKATVKSVAERALICLAH